MFPINTAGWGWNTFIIAQHRPSIGKFLNGFAIGWLCRCLDCTDRLQSDAVNVQFHSCMLAWYMKEIEQTTEASLQIPVRADCVCRVLSWEHTDRILKTKSICVQSFLSLPLQSSHIKKNPAQSPKTRRCSYKLNQTRNFQNKLIYRMFTQTITNIIMIDRRPESIKKCKKAPVASSTICQM